MSDLQIALAVIGAVLVGLVYAYNLWQERRLHKSLDKAFAAPEADVLLDSADGRVEPVINRSQSEGQLVRSDVFSGAGPGSPAADPVLDHCMTIRCAVETAETLRGALCEALAAFGSRVRVLDSAGSDERSGSEAAVFLVAVQLVDRGGALDQDVLDGVQATIDEVCLNHSADVTSAETIPVAVERGKALESVVAESDILIGFNIVPAAAKGFDSGQVQAAALAGGFKVTTDEKWLFQDEQGATVATLVPFDSSDVSGSSGWGAGATILVDVPRVTGPCEAIDIASGIAAAMAKDLDGRLVDDNRRPLTEAGITAIRAQLAAISARMVEHGVAPGSARALRLFE